MASLQWPAMPCSMGIAWQLSCATSAWHCAGLPATMHVWVSLTMRSRTQSAAAPSCASAASTCARDACTAKPAQKEATGASSGTPQALRSAEKPAPLPSV